MTATLTENGSNLVKAFQRYQPVEESESEEEKNEDEVAFTNINTGLQGNEEEEDAVITCIPSHSVLCHALIFISGHSQKQK